MDRAGERESRSRPSIPLAAGLLTFVGCLVAFGAIAAMARQPHVPAIDTAMTALLHDVSSPGLDGLMSALTELGGSVVLAALAGLAVLLLAARQWTAAARFVALALVGSLVLNHSLKVLFGRPRPVLDWAEARADHAFPSGHAMNSLVVYVALALVVWQVWGRRAGILAVAVSVVLSLAIGASRIYLGVHWLTDVVGGYLAGVMWLLVVAVAAAGVSGLRRPRGGGSVVGGATGTGVQRGPDARDPRRQAPRPPGFRPQGPGRRGRDPDGRDPDGRPSRWPPRPPGSGAGRSGDG